MARFRSRPQRILLLLLALLLLLLLFELDRWLPGTWRGGSGGGFRAMGEAGRVDPTRAAPEADLPADEPEDPGAIVPPDTPPPAWPPRDGVVIEVRGPDGDAAAGWRLGTGDGGPEDSAPDAAGRTIRRDRRLVEEGFRIRRAGRLVRHRQGTAEPASHWVVHLPAGTPPEQRRPGPIRIGASDAETDRPLGDLRATWLAGGVSRTATDDAQGQLEIPAPRDGAPFEVTVETADHMPRTLQVAPRDPQPREATLARRHAVRARFRWPDGTPATFSAAEARAADGTVLARLAGEAGRPLGPDLAFDVPSTALAGGRLQLRPLRGGAEGLRIDLPLAGLAGSQVLPATRTIRVQVQGVDGRPLDRAQVLVFPEAGESDGPETAPWRVLTNLQGEATVTTPAGLGVGLLVTKGKLGPAGRRLRGIDGTDRIDLVLDDGVQVPVQVVDAQDQPMAGATVAARGVIDGVRIEHGASVRTDAQGRCVIGPLPAGEVEIYATAPDRAWASTVVAAGHAMGTVRMPLEAARSLRLVVADPFGAPLANVRIDLTVASGGAPLAAPPGEPRHATDAQGRARLTHLPARRYDVRLTAPGYVPRTLRGIVPGDATHFVTLLAR